MASCFESQRAKGTNQQRQGQLISEFEEVVNGVWYIDVIGKLPRSGPFEYIRILLDGCSKLTILEPLGKLSSKVIVDKLNRIMCRKDSRIMQVCGNG